MKYKINFEYEVVIEVEAETAHEAYKKAEQERQKLDVDARFVYTKDWFQEE